MMIWIEKPAIAIIFLIKEEEKLAKEKEVVNAMDVPSLLGEKAKARARIKPLQRLQGKTDCQMELESADFI